MNTLPVGGLVVRTWFGNDDEWHRLKAAVATPSEDGFLASVRTVDDRAYEGIDAETLRSLTPHGRGGALVSFIADEITLTTEGWPMLVVSVWPPEPDPAEDLRPFRVIASELWNVENNLNLANMDWVHYQRAAGADGVFRGF